MKRVGIAEVKSWLSECLRAVGRARRSWDPQGDLEKSFVLRLQQQRENAGHHE